MPPELTRDASVDSPSDIPRKGSREAKNAQNADAVTGVSMERIVALCKRRGFIFQSSEIYGGLGSTYDYGHYGVLLKNNVKAEWWRAVIQERDDMVALDAAILMHPRTWEASGHIQSFTDPLVQCTGKCKKRWRADHLTPEPRTARSAAPSAAASWARRASST